VLTPTVYSPPDPPSAGGQGGQVVYLCPPISAGGQAQLIHLLELEEVTDEPLLLLFDGT